MGLQVWIPFTDGTLKQQGSSTILPSGTAFTLNTEGKLGKCIKTKNNGHIDLGYNGNQINTGSISFGGWFKFNKTEIQNTVGSYNYDETRNYAIGNLIGNSSYGGVALVWATNSLYADNGVVNTIRVYSTLRSTQNGARSTSATDLNFDTWYNIYLVFNKETKMLQLWINGNLSKYTAMTDFSDARDLNLRLNYSAIWGGNGPSFNIPFLVNDLRIYDEALDEKEIKRISQGLILHYKMNDDKLESTQNLITTEDCLSSTCYNGSTNKYGYGVNTDIYKTVTTYNNKKGTKVYMGTNGNNCYPYVYISGMYTSNGTNSPAYKTLSFDYYTTVSTSICPYKLGSGSGIATYTVIANGIERTGMGTNSVDIPIVPNVWNHVEITFNGTTDADAQWGYIQNRPAHISNTSNFWFFANMQLEVKDHATGYAGVGGIRNSTKVWDNSGYNNDGTINGTLSINTDTPKYKYSTIFASGANYIDADRGAMVRDAITVNLWCKFTTWSNPISCTEGGGWNIENNSGYVSFPVYISGVGYKVARSTKTPANLTDGNWHMLTGTFDRENIKIYIDSILEGTAATDSTNMIGYNGNNAILIGAEASGTHAPASTSFVGNISDVRIYATALSLEDIKSLYQNCVTIDLDGVVRGQLRG